MSWLSSIFKRKPSQALWTGKVYSQLEVRTALGCWEYAADRTYAEVNEEALPAFYDWYKKKLFDLGMVRWDPKADCDNFSILYLSLFQLRYYLAQWEIGTMPNAESPAVASFWYRPAAGTEGHAINAVLTQNGVRFIEPQSGQVLTLTDDERASRLRVIF